MDPERIRRKLAIRNELLRNTLTEFFGTAMLLMIGNSINAQSVLSDNHNTWLGNNLGWGFTITFVVMACAKTSGGHLNPAISLIMYTFGRLSFARFIIYSLAQTAGAFVGAAIAFLLYYDAINHFDGGIRSVVGETSTALIFSPYPQDYVSVTTALFDQIIGTGVLGFFLSVLMDRRCEVPVWLHPFYFGLLLTMIGTAFGLNVGYPINPARDFGPRLFSYFAGYGIEVFSFNQWRWWWIPIIGPLIGAVCGAWLYQLLIGFHVPDDDAVVLPQYQIIEPRNKCTNGCRQMETINLNSEKLREDE